MNGQDIPRTCRTCEHRDSMTTYCPITEKRVSMLSRTEWDEHMAEVEGIRKDLKEKLKLYVGKERKRIEAELERLPTKPVALGEIVENCSRWIQHKARLVGVGEG